MSQVRLAPREPRVRAPSRPPLPRRARAPGGGGAGSSPPTRGRTRHAPLPPAVRPQCHCPFLAPSSPEAQSVLCLSAHSAARSHQLVCVPSHPALHTKETWARAASPPRTGPAPPEERARERTPSARPPRAPAPAPGSGLRGPPRPPTPRRDGAGQPRPTAPFRGVSPHPACTSGAPGEPAEGDTRTGKAAAGRSRRRRRPAPGSGAPSAGRPDSDALPEPRAPARAAPARRSRVPPPPPPPGLHRLLRPSGCRTLPDRAPNPAAQSPSLLFGPPSPTKRRPDWRDPSGLPSNHRARRARRR